MNRQTINDLRQLKGIGDILAQRLVQGGLDTFAKIAAAGEKGLRAVKGINPLQVPAIVEQAKELAGSKQTDKGLKSQKEIKAEKPQKAEKAARVEELQAKSAELRDRLQHLANTARDRFAEELSGSVGKKLTRDLVSSLDALALLEEKLGKRLKQSGKVLLKAEKRLAGLAESELKKIRKGVKKTKKALKKAVA